MAPERPREPDLGHSIEVMRTAHEGQIDKCGRPYYLRRSRELPREQRGMRHRFAQDAERVLEALRALGDTLHTTIPAGDL